MMSAAIRPPPEVELYAFDYPTAFLARLDIIINALPDKAAKREFLDVEFAHMLNRFARWQCRHRAGVPTDDPNKLGLVDFVELLRGLNHRKRRIEAGRG